MNNYKGLFTFDVDNHRYLPIEQADGLISDMFYNPEPKEEPKDHYYIDYDGDIMIVEALDYEPKIKAMKQIGNYFETEEEAEKAVEKLKAWKRLKDNGLKFECWKRDKNYWGDFYITAEDQTSCDDMDLDLLFGGEE